MDTPWESLVVMDGMDRVEYEYAEGIIYIELVINNVLSDSRSACQTGVLYMYNTDEQPN